MEDDCQLEDIIEKYRKGELLTGELKKIVIGILQEFVQDFQNKRSQVTDHHLQEFLKF